VQRSFCSSIRETAWASTPSLGMAAKVPGPRLHSRIGVATTAIRHRLGLACQVRYEAGETPSPPGQSAVRASAARRIA